MGDSYGTVKVAAVQAASVFLDREGSTQKACRLIREAGQNGARIIAFPEGFIPAHPIWYHHHAATGAIANKLAVELFKNAVEIPSPQTEALGEAARAANAYVVMGVCEKLPGTTGTMFNSQIYFGPDSNIIRKHQKIMPTVGERLVHMGGYGDTFGAFPGIRADVGAHLWRELQSARGVRVDCGRLDDHMIEMLKAGPEAEQFLRDPNCCGGTLIVDPLSRIIAGPMGPEEGILYADCNLDLGIQMKLRHDFAGHYNRPDIFQMHINRAAPQLYRVHNDPAALTAPDTGALPSPPPQLGPPVDE